MAETWKVLLVEDDEVDREAVKRALARSDVAARVEEAADVATAVTRMLQEEFDCAIVDYQLPDGTAWDLLDARDLREQADSGPAVVPAIIILTAHGSESVAVEFLQKGACDYVSKSDLSPTRIGHAVRNAVRVARLRREAAQIQDVLAGAESCCRYLFSRCRDPGVLADLDGRVLDVNPVACDVFGVSREAVLGRSVADLAPPELDSDLLRHVRSGGGRIDGATSRVRLLSRDPSARFDLTCTKASFAGRPAVLLHLRRSPAEGSG